MKMTADQLRKVVQTYRFSDRIFIIVDSLPEPEKNQFQAFLRGSACPIADGRQSYAYVPDFERFLAQL